MTNQLEYDDEVAFHAVRRLYDYARYERDARSCSASRSRTRTTRTSRGSATGICTRTTRSTCRPRRRCRSSELDPHSRRLWHDCAVGDVEITEDDVRASRHGYYANLSYVDERIGEVLAALEACGLADDTVVIFTLRPRRLPRRARALLQDVVPRAPGARAAHRPCSRRGSRRAACASPSRSPTSRRRSPTSRARALGRARAAGRRPQPRCRCSRAQPEDPDAHASPASTSPRARSRRWSCSAAGAGSSSTRRATRISSSTSRPTRSSSSTSPRSPSTRDVVAEFRDEVGRRWDLEALDRAVRESQQARLAVFRALQQGVAVPVGLPAGAAGVEAVHAEHDGRRRARPAVALPAARESRGLPRVRRAARRRGARARPAASRARSRVRVAACAICHSDLAFADGAWGGELPAVYGHEAAGVVEEVGPGVEPGRAGRPRRRQPAPLLRALLLLRAGRVAPLRGRVPGRSAKAGCARATASTCSRRCTRRVRRGGRRRRVAARGRSRRRCLSTSPRSSAAAS